MFLGTAVVLPYSEDNIQLQSPFPLHKDRWELVWILRIVVRLTMKRFPYREHVNKSGLFRLVKISWGIQNTEGTTFGVGNPLAVNYWSLLQRGGITAHTVLKLLRHLLLNTGLDAALIWPSTAMLVAVWYNNLNWPTMLSDYANE